MVHPMMTEVEHRQAPYQHSTVELIEEEPGQEDEVERDVIRLWEIERRGRQIHLRFKKAETENSMLRSEQRLGLEKYKGVFISHMNIQRKKDWKICWQIINGYGIEMQKSEGD